MSERKTISAFRTFIFVSSGKFSHIAEWRRIVCRISDSRITAATSLRSQAQKLPLSDGIFGSGRASFLPVESINTLVFRLYDQSFRNRLRFLEAGNYGIIVYNQPSDRVRTRILLATEIQNPISVQKGLGFVDFGFFLFAIKNAGGNRQE